jgi:hypothetical protein
LRLRFVAPFDSVQGLPEFQTPIEVQRAAQPTTQAFSKKDAKAFSSQPIPPISAVATT